MNEKQMEAWVLKNCKFAQYNPQEVEPDPTIPLRYQWQPNPRQSWPGPATSKKWYRNLESQTYHRAADDWTKTGLAVCGEDIRKPTYSWNEGEDPPLPERRKLCTRCQAMPTGKVASQPITKNRKLAQTEEYLRIPKGVGFWITDRFPIGGDFDRAKEDIRLKVLRRFDPYKGATLEGQEIDKQGNPGRKIAVDGNLCQPDAAGFSVKLPSPGADIRAVWPNPPPIL